MADMKLLLLFKELMLLKDFKKQDQQLTKKLEGVRVCDGARMDVAIFVVNSIRSMGFNPP